MPVVPAQSVIVLLGWLGAKDRHLAKYAEMYEGNTRSTVSTSAAPQIQ